MKRRWWPSNGVVGLVFTRKLKASIYNGSWGVNRGRVFASVAFMTVWATDIPRFRMQNAGHLNGSAHAQLEEEVFGCDNIAV